MVNKLLIFVFLAVTAVTAAAQSGRPIDPNGKSPETAAIAEQSASDLFTVAFNYRNDRITVLEQEKVPFTEEAFLQILSEQKQLAAKYAAELKSRKELSVEDHYYLGRLHWLAKNREMALKSFEIFLSGAAAADELKKQTARTVVVDIAAEYGELEKAESTLSDYLKNRPIKTRPIAIMQKQMVVSYSKAGKYELAAGHAEAAFEATKKYLFESDSRARALGLLLDAGITNFELQKRLGNKTKAIATLMSLRQYAANVNSHNVYFRALDEHIRYLIETGERRAAMTLYANSDKTLEKEIESDSVRLAIRRNLNKRRIHYKILGTPAPELEDIDSVLPADQITLSGLKGKVVLLDFWATWCGPCYEAFPRLVEWQKELEPKGLVVLGMTRFYAEDSSKKGRRGEIEFLKNFKTEQELTYPFVVASNQSNQINYGALSLPTAVLIDRSGKIRFVETGTSKSRLDEIEKMIRLLLDE